MTEEARELRNLYFRRYYQTHREQIRMNQINYWRRRLERMAEEAAKADPVATPTNDSTP